MTGARLFVVLAGLLLPGAAGTPAPDPFERPAPGSARLDVLSPRVLEVEVFDALAEGRRPPRWDFVEGGTASRARAVPVVVRVDGARVDAEVRGFRRRALHVPFRGDRLLLGSALIVQLASPVPGQAHVAVEVRDLATPGAPLRVEARANPLRRGLAVHVSQAGFAPHAAKRAFVGRYLGDAGELEVEADTFTVVDAATGVEAFRGPLQPRRDVGYGYPAYQGVREADFSAFDRPGTWRVAVPGLGASEPFPISRRVPAEVAHVFALGLYHQRCGVDLGAPHTSFGHPACHLAPADVPTDASASVLERAGLATLAEARYPFVRRGPVDVSGGHHDAGDYGKYTVTSAQLIGALVFAVDVLPGVAAVDDLGLPESGDGDPDLLQIAAREAAFLARLQDDDGGFYSLVQPRDRPYEGDRLPQHGDRQAVFPKGTVATAAAVAALAQIGASPAFVARHPAEARAHVAAAERGWGFLERAWARHGRDGAYQRVHHYGEVFADADEIAWAATELFLATGSPAARREAEQALARTGDAIRRWGWWRLFEGWGGAFRACAFAATAGRARSFDGPLTARCRAEVRAAADDVLGRVAASAYGTALPLEDKRFRTVGWFFSTDAAFDLLAGLALEDRAEGRAAWQSCLAFETGGNPADVSYVSGLGRRNFQEIVHQVAQNDGREAPPTGLPIGNLLPGIPGWTPLARHAAALTWPSDDDPDAPFAPYDRATDVFAPNAEPVSARMARSLAGAAFFTAGPP